MISICLNQMGRNQDEETRGKDSKGKEVAGNSRGITRPPLNFLAILNNYGKTIGTSCPDEICRQLYAGVYLKPNTLMYFVDEESKKNCFVLFARELTIKHSGEEEHWKWETPSGEDIEVAKLVKVSWLDIKGNFRTINLSPGTLYEIVFQVKKFDGEYISDFNIDLVIKPQHSKALTRTASLEGKPLEKWFELVAGEFRMSPEYVGNMEFGVEKHDWHWKSGVVVKCAIIRPKK